MGCQTKDARRDGHRCDFAIRINGAEQMADDGVEVGRSLDLETIADWSGSAPQLFIHVIHVEIDSSRHAYMICAPV